jgi:hypothetical protein
VIILKRQSKDKLLTNKGESMNAVNGNSQPDIRVFPDSGNDYHTNHSI